MATVECCVAKTLSLMAYLDFFSAAVLAPFADALFLYRRFYQCSYTLPVWRHLSFFKIFLMMVVLCAVRLSIARVLLILRTFVLCTHVVVAINAPGHLGTKRSQFKSMVVGGGSFHLHLASSRQCMYR